MDNRPVAFVTGAGRGIGRAVAVDLARAWQGPFPGLTVIHTGGVTLGNLGPLSGLDPTGVFCGSALTAGSNTPGAMADEARRWLGALRPRSD